MPDPTSSNNNLLPTSSSFSLDGCRKRDGVVAVATIVALLTLLSMMHAMSIQPSSANDEPPNIALVRLEKKMNDVAAAGQQNTRVLSKLRSRLVRSENKFMKALLKVVDPEGRTVSTAPAPAIIGPTTATVVSEPSRLSWRETEGAKAASEGGTTEEDKGTKLIAGVVPLHQEKEADSSPLGIHPPVAGTQTVGYVDRSLSAQYAYRTPASKDDEALARRLANSLSPAKRPQQPPSTEGKAGGEQAICLKAGCKWNDFYGCIQPLTGPASRMNHCHTLDGKPPEKPVGGGSGGESAAAAVAGGGGDIKTKRREELPFCTKFNDTIEGEWSSASTKHPMWEPHKCRLRWFSPEETASCLSGKKVSFFGDSLLHSVFGWLEEHLMLAGAGSKQAVNSQDFHRPGGKVQFGFHTASVSGSIFEFWWAPSVYHQRPLTLMESSEYKKRDVVLLGMAAWDMGTYYKGIDTYYKELTAVVASMIAEQTALPQEGGGVKPRVIINSLHKAWPDRCLDPDSPCTKCNSPAKEQLMRKALMRGVHCGYHRARAVGKGGIMRSGVEEPYSILSTFAFTNTPYARADPVTNAEGVKNPDALHYGKNTTMMEAQFLLNMICPREESAALEVALEGQEQGQDGRKEEGGGLLHGPKMHHTLVPESDCGFNGYDNEMHQLDAKHGHDTLETCVAPKWKPKHNRRLMRQP